jgi:hypothetical protein
LPIVAILAITGVAMGYYFWRVTGNPFQMPYSLNRQTYAVAPVFIGQRLRPEPMYHHPVMRNFYLGWEASTYLRTRSVRGFVAEVLTKLDIIWWFFLGPALPISLLSLPFVIRDRRMRLLLIIALTTIAALLLEAWHNAHYLAPLTCVIYAVVLQCMRHLRLWRRHRNRLGVFLVRALVLMCLAVFFFNLRAQYYKLPHDSAHYPWHWQRAEILERLSSAEVGQLVIVRYAPDHDVSHEWVYNRADIDHSKVVWARDMGKQNEELIRYFRNRQVWFLEPDFSPPKISPYCGESPAPCSSQAR